MNNRGNKALKSKQEEDISNWLSVEIWYFILVTLSPNDFRAFFLVSHTWRNFTKNYEATYWKEQLTIKALKTRVSNKVLSLKQAQDIENELLQKTKNMSLSFDFVNTANFSLNIQTLFKLLDIPRTVSQETIQSLKPYSKRELYYFLASPSGIDSVIDKEKIPVESLFSDEALDVLQLFRRYGFHMISTFTKNWGISLASILSNQALIKITSSPYVSFTLSSQIYGNHFSSKINLVMFGINHGLTPQLISLKEIEELNFNFLASLCRQNGIALLKKEPHLIEIYKTIQKNELTRKRFEQNLYSLTGNQKHFDIFQYIPLKVLLTQSRKIVPLLWSKEALDAFKTGILLVKTTEEGTGVYFQDNNKNGFTMTPTEFEETLEQAQKPKEYSLEELLEITMFYSPPPRPTKPSQPPSTSTFKPR